MLQLCFITDDSVLLLQQLSIHILTLIANYVFKVFYDDQNLIFFQRRTAIE